ncbi:hypothetical protein GJ744_000176 [Endocarpon pusillum]|uniref:Uncharacterized protein n=1 Tax=Endocarpon pusillum TaxID=364733 RepID=A0A8H7EC42_9EURO|nr:hypothetical protein GJ744_000176 [Endocarpon pusillum]
MAAEQQPYALASSCFDTTMEIPCDPEHAHWPIFLLNYMESTALPSNSIPLGCPDICSSLAQDHPEAGPYSTSGPHTLHSSNPDAVLM